MWFLGLLKSKVLWIAIMVGTAFVGGYRVASLECEVEKKEALERMIQLSNRIMEENLEIEREYIAKEKEREIVYEVIREEVIEYVERNDLDSRECLDPDGVHIWNEANKGTLHD